MRIEEQIADLAKLYLPLALPILNLTTRMFLNVLSRDIRGIHRRLFSLPEDLMFISLSLEFAGIAGVIPNFTAFYQRDNYDPTTAGIIVSAILYFVAFLIHWWNKNQVEPRFQSVFISGHEIEKRIKKERKTRNNLPATTNEVMRVFNGEYIVGTFCWFLELAI